MKGKRGKGKIAALLLIAVCLACSIFIACGGDGGKAGVPVDPIDESGFGGVRPDSNVTIETDADMTVDGKFDEAAWSQSVPMTVAFGDGVEFSVKTLLGDKGVYIAFSVKDTKIYGNTLRSVQNNSGMELYIAVGDEDTPILFRHDATDATIRYIGSKNGSSYKYGRSYYMPAFSRMNVHGKVNSRNTEGIDFETFVRWDALCSDYMTDGAVNPDFVKPESVGILPAYNRASGENTDDAREQWCSAGGVTGSPESFFRFGGNGFTGTDAQDAVIGDSSFGRIKSVGWKIEGTGDSEIATSTKGYSQAAFFKGITDSDYVATAKIEYKNAYNGESDPQVGMIAAANHTEVHSFMWAAKKNSGRFLTNNVNRDNDVWAYDRNVSLAADNAVRMTVVKKDNVLYAFAGNKDTEKFGGTLVAIKEAANLGITAPGLYAYNCEAVFSDYEVKQGTEAADAALSGHTGRLVIDNQAGGSVSGDRAYFIRGEKVSLEVECFDGYKLTALKVNDTDVRDTEVFRNGILTVTVDAETVTVTPVFERITDDVYSVSGRVVLDKELSLRDVSILILGVSDKGYVYRPKLNTRVEYTEEEANGDLKEEAANCNRYAYETQLPNGTYNVIIDYLDGIKHTEEQITVGGGSVQLKQVKISTPFGGNDLGAPASGRFTLTASDDDNNGIAMSGNTTTNLNRTYLKGASGTSYVFTATVKIGGAWNNDGYPTVGIIFAGLKNDTYSFHVDGRNYGNQTNKYDVINISGTSWYYPVGGRYVQNTDKSEVTLTAVRDGAIFYLFANGAFVTKFTTEAIEDTAETCVGFSSVASLSEWTSWEFSNEQADVDAVIAQYNRSVTVTVQGEGAYELESDLVIIGSDVAIGLTADEGWYLSALQVNGQDAFDAYDKKTGVLTLKNVTADTVVTVTFGKMENMVNVTGGYGFDEYSDGDESVEVYIGVFEASVDKENKTFAASVPAGEYTVTASCDKYVSVTKKVTVSAEQAALGALTFDTVKLANDLLGKELQYDYDAAEKSYTATAKQAIASVAGAEYTDAFAIKANIKYNTGLWNAAGFLVYAGGTRYEIGFDVEANRTVKLHILQHSPWAEFTTAVFTTLPADVNSCTEGIDVELIFKDGKYYAIAGGAVFTFDSNTVGLSGFGKLFDTTDIKQLGIITRDTPNAVFKSLACTTNADKTAAKIEALKCNVTVTVNGGNGSHDFASDRVVYLGENIAVTLTPDADYRVASITVNDADAMTDYDVMTGIFTLKNVQKTTAVTVTFERIPKPGTVTGSYSFGDLDEDSTVKITIGVVEATLDKADKTFTASVPAGTHTVTVSCDKYVSVTQQVVVAEEQNSSVDTLTFDTPKLTENIKKGDDGYATVTKSDRFHTVYFENTLANGDFAIWAKIKFPSNATSGWTGGFVVLTEVTNRPQVIFLSAADNTLVLRGVGTFGKHGFDYKAGEDNEFVLIYKASEEAYYFVYNGCLAKVDANSVSEDNKLHFKSGSSRTLGLGAVDFETKFKDYGYTTDAAKVARMLEGYQCTVSVTVEGGNGNHDFANDRVVYQGENVAVTLTPDEGYRVASITVNNEDAMSGYNVATGIFTFNAQKTTAVIITFEEIPQNGTVTGSYSFGKLDDDASVKVTIGAVEATLDKTNKTFTASVPAGTYTLTMSCDKYVTVTKQATVNANQTSAVGALMFDTPKLSENLTKDGEGYVTVTKSGGAHAVAFAGAQSTSDFAMWATIVPAGNGWAGGIYVGVGTDWTYFIVSADNYLNVRGGAHYGQHEFSNTINADNKVVLIYKASEDAYYFIYNGCLAKMTKDNAQGKGGGWGDETYVKQFGEGTRTFGLAAVDNPTKFKDYGYTTDSAKVDQMLAELNAQP